VPAYRSGDRPFDVKLDPGARRRMRIVSMVRHVHERQQQVREETAFLDPADTASRWRGRILAETLRQSGNCAVTNKDCGIRFVFLVIANTWAIGRRMSYYRAGHS